MQKFFVAMVVLSTVLIYENAFAQPAIVAVVGSKTITTVQLERVMGTTTINLQSEEARIALDGLIEDEIIRQEAKTQGIVVDSKQIDQVVNIIKQRFTDEAGLENAMSKKGITLDDLKERGQIVFQRVQLIAKCVMPRVGITQQMFEKFCEDYAVKVHARHILVATEEEAAGLLKQIKEGADFAELASKHSTCPRHARGGDLGFFGRGQMVKEFEDAAFNLTKENPLSGVVKTQFGYHILQFVDNKIATREESIEIDRIKQDLYSQLMGQNFIVAGDGLEIQILKPLEERFIGDNLKATYEKWMQETKKRIGVKVIVK